MFRSRSLAAVSAALVTSCATTVDGVEFPEYEVVDLGEQYFPSLVDTPTNTNDLLAVLEQREHGTPAHALHPPWKIHALLDRFRLPSRAAAIDSSGRAVGWTDRPFASGAAFAWQDGELTTLWNGEWEPADVNDSGTVVGSVLDVLGFSGPPGVHRLPVIFAAGAAQVPELQGRANGVNAAGVVVGTEEQPDGVRAFLLRDGFPHVLDEAQSGANDVNDANLVVGWADVGGRIEAVQWTFDPETGVATRSLLPPLVHAGATRGDALAINASGEVAGWDDTPEGTKATLWRSALQIESLGALGPWFTASAANDINASTEVVGWSHTSDNTLEDLEPRAFLWRKGVMVDLNDLLVDGDGWELLEATGINDDGWIVGRGRRDGRERGFLLKPVEE